MSSRACCRDDPDPALATHLAHAASVRDEWLASAMLAAEAEDREEGVWDTEALCAGLPEPRRDGPRPRWRPAPGDEVMLCDLSSRDDLNGLPALLLRWVEAKSRWAVAVGSERVLLRRSSFMALSMARVLQDDDLLAAILAHLSAAELLACASSCAHLYGVVDEAPALQAIVWRERCREQRARRCPRELLTEERAAAIAAAPGFSTWEAEFHRAEAALTRADEANELFGWMLQTQSLDH